MEEHKKYSLGNLFLGSILIALGLLLAAEASGLLNQAISFSPRFILPILIIYIGLAMIPIRTRSLYIVGSIFVTLLVISISLLILRSCNTGNSLMPQDDLRWWHSRMMNDGRVQWNGTGWDIDPSLY